MQPPFYNQPVVNWARQALAQPVDIRLRFATRWARMIVYLLLFSIPLLFIAAMAFLKLTGGTEARWAGIVLCGGVMTLPVVLIIALGSFVRQKFAKSLNVSGVRSSMGKTFLWENLYYVDHVSKIVRVANVSRKVEDNQIELVFSDGKAIIPPMIHDRERVWQLVNSIPAQVKWDGEVRSSQQSSTAAADKFNDFLNSLDQLTADRGKVR